MRSAFDGSGNWLQPISVAAEAQAVLLLRSKVKVMKRSPLPSALTKDGDFTVNLPVLRGATAGRFTRPPSTTRPSQVIDQRRSKSEISVKNCLLKMVNWPVAALVVEIVAGAARYLNSCIAGFAVRSGNTMPSQQKFPSCFFSP